MDGKSMKNKTLILVSGASNLYTGLHSFSELRTLGREMYYLFKCHKAYICLLKYSNLFQDSKCLAGSELWMVNQDAELLVMTP